ncbi:hypothetical protein Tco_0890753 [Tanacetum coccineum]|uniref:Uncharacterized protein n=1 Tax=Tanacetum coccineum TaxID=301880 RepID=A0ABQ5C1D4_9ASTR
MWGSGATKECRGECGGKGPLVWRGRGGGECGSGVMGTRSGVEDYVTVVLLNLESGEKVSKVGLEFNTILCERRVLLGIFLTTLLRGTEAWTRLRIYGLLALQEVLLSCSEVLVFCSWRDSRVDGRSYLLSGATNSSEANGIIQKSQVGIGGVFFVYFLIL